MSTIKCRFSGMPDFQDPRFKIQTRSRENASQLRSRERGMDCVRVGPSSQGCGGGTLEGEGGIWGPHIHPNVHWETGKRLLWHFPGPASRCLQSRVGLWLPEELAMTSTRPTHPKPPPPQSPPRHHRAAPVG